MPEDEQVEYNKIEYNGVDLRTYGLYANGDKVFSSPEKDYDVIPIPGRSGDIYIWNGTYKNVTVPYDVILLPTDTNGSLYGGDYEKKFRKNVADIRNILLSPNGYVKIRDSYNPDEYRLGVFQGPLDIDAILLSAGKATLEFNCRPERFLDSGSVPVTVDGLTSELVITNPTNYPSMPLIAMLNNGSSKTVVVTNNSNTTSHFVIRNLNGAFTDEGTFAFMDSDIFNCYKGDMQMQDGSYVMDSIVKKVDSNSSLTFTDDYDYPILYPGENRFLITTGASQPSAAYSFIVFGRWYKL